MNSESTGSTGLFDLMAWLEVNKKRLAMALVGLVVLVFLIMVVRWNREQTVAKANEALLSLRMPLSANSTSTPPDPSAFLKVAEDYSGTGAGERALLLAAGTQFSQGKYAEAQAQFDRFIQQHGGSTFAPTAAYGKAAAIEAQGKQDEALTAYQNVVNQYGKSAVVDDAKLAIARIYEAKNQPEQALKLYNELITPGAVGSATDEATNRKKHLLIKHPNLEKVSAPAAGVSTNAPALPASKP